MESLQDLNDMASIERSIPTKQRSSMPVWVSNPSFGVSHRRVGLRQKFSSIDELSDEFTKCILLHYVWLIWIINRPVTIFYTEHLNKFTRKVSLMPHISPSWVSRWNIPVLNFGEQPPSPPPPASTSHWGFKKYSRKYFNTAHRKFFKTNKASFKNEIWQQTFPCTFYDFWPRANEQLISVGNKIAVHWWITARKLFSNSSSIF